MEETEHHLKLCVKEIIKETPDSISVILSSVNGEHISYKAGQFITFIIKLRGKELRRSYSISSSPAADSDLTVTIKRIINGEVSGYLFENLREGDVLEALPPAGRFILQTDPAIQRDIFLIAAGSGITPLYSILKDVLLREPASRITLLYSSKNIAHTIFYDTLRALERKNREQLRCIFLFSQPEGDDYKYRQFLNNGLLEKLINENLRFSREHALFYLCGPFPFMRMADITITFMGFEEEKIVKENFVILSEQNALNTLPVIEDKSEKLVYVKFKGNEYAVEVPYGKTILSAASEKKIYLPYSCEAGICGTCAARCVQGNVKMSVNDVLTSRDLKKGYVLTCTGYPETKNVLLEFDR